MVVFTNCVEFTLQQNHIFIPPIMLSEIQSNTTGPFDSLVSGNQMSAPFAKERIGFCAHFDQRFKRCFGRGHVRYMSDDHEQVVVCPPLCSTSWAIIGMETTSSIEFVIFGGDRFVRCRSFWRRTKPQFLCWVLIEVLYHCRQCLSPFHIQTNIDQQWCFLHQSDQRTVNINTIQKSAAAASQLRLLQMTITCIPDYADRS